MPSDKFEVSVGSNHTIVSSVSLECIARWVLVAKKATMRRTRGGGLDARFAYVSDGVLSEDDLRRVDNGT